MPRRADGRPPTHDGRGAARRRGHRRLLRQGPGALRRRLPGPQGRAGRAARHQRRRQVHHPQGGVRPGPDHGRHHPVEGQDITAIGAEAARAGRPRPRPRRPRRCSRRSPSRRTSAWAATSSPTSAQVDAEVERVVEYFPWIPSRAGQLAGHALGRRAAAARHRPGPHRPARAADDRRDVARSRAAHRSSGSWRSSSGSSTRRASPSSWSSSRPRFALGYTDRAYFMEKGEVRYSGPSAGLTERGDLLRSVFLAGASAGFATADAQDGG